MYKIGVGKADITSFVENIGMLGYGKPDHIVQGIETPIYARAFVISSSDTKVAFVNAELCFITQSIKNGVIQYLKEHHPTLGYSDENIMLTAQHTHSTPGGYSHFGFYNITIPGFIPEIYDTIVNGIAEAILQAEASLTPGSISVRKGKFPAHIPVAFNRSIEAYNANPETENVSTEEAHLAVNREMTLLLFENSEGIPLGVINWFGVHTTSVSNDCYHICSDNKGYASQYLEQAYKDINPHFISAFAQGACGDVTPNYKWDEEKKWTRGKFKDDYKSAQYNGYLQYHQADQLIRKTPEAVELPIRLDYVHQYVDMTQVIADKQFVPFAQEIPQTSPPALGVAFLAGTLEGPGLSPLLHKPAILMSKVCRWYEQNIRTRFVDKKTQTDIQSKYKVHNPKNIIIESHLKHILATPNIKGLIIPSFADLMIRNIKYFYKESALNTHHWIQEKLPMQIFLIGSIAIIGIPAEITTVAAERLQETLLSTLKNQGITTIILSPYANAYSGYITTYEEYMLQLYEGGHTIFGKWTLAAYQTVFRDLASELQKAPSERSSQSSIFPAIFTKEDLALWKRPEFA